MSHQGQRENPRYAVEASVRVEFGETTMEGECTNLSSGGLCASLRCKLDLGTEVRLALTLVFDIDTFSEPLSVRARSVWCTPLGDGFQVGLQFLAIDADQATYLAMFLRYLDEGREARKPPPTPDPDVFS